MKVIISHDIDYITFTEHFRDLTIPKYIVRNFIEVSLGYIKLFEFIERFKNIKRNKFHNIIELLEFDQGKGIPATVFIAVNRGRNGLNYSLRLAEEWICKVQELGFDVGVHGIDYQRYNIIEYEKSQFELITKIPAYGIRIHYVKTNRQTYELLEKAGYLYDSTDTGHLKNPYKIGRMWEFPIHLMDSLLINNGRPWQSATLTQAQKRTEKLINDAIEAGVQYFNILFHDNHFCDAFHTWKEWYIWLIDYIKNQGFEFISYGQAVIELERA